MVEGPRQSRGFNMSEPAHAEDYKGEASVGANRSVGCMYSILMYPILTDCRAGGLYGLG